MLKQPRMLVCPRTPLLGYDRAASKEAEQLIIQGHWRREYKKDENIGNCQMFEVILLNKENQPLHNVPMSYVAKGANQGSFSQEWQKFLTEITVCHAIANSIAPRPKDARFNALCVFEFEVNRELVGQKQKSFTCRVVGHTEPNKENWTNYFLGYNPSLKNKIWGGLQPTMPLLTPETNTEPLALPGTVEE